MPAKNLPNHYNQVANITQANQSKRKAKDATKLLLAHLTEI